MAMVVDDWMIDDDGDGGGDGGDANFTWFYYNVGAVVIVH
jgi:hypothetical protein